MQILNSNKKIISKIPNFLTIFRIILLLPIIIIASINDLQTLYSFKVKTSSIEINLSLVIIGIIFSIAAITDFLDGFIARKFKVVSNFGKFWDPLADKILVNSVLVILSFNQIVPIWITLLLIIRDIIMDGLRMMASNKNIIIPANFLGKAKTIALMLGIIIVIFIGVKYTETNILFNKIWYWFVQNLIMYFSLILSISSLVFYFIKYKKWNK